MCMVCLLMFTFLGIWGVRNRVKKHGENFATQSLYTGGFSTSVTGTSGSAMGVFTNEDHTAAALLFRIDDLSRMADNVNAYSMMVTGQTETSEPEPIESHPTGALYKYGNTGYFVATYYNKEPFPCQILAAFFMNQETLAVDTGATTLGDKYDIWSIAMNPGATGTYQTNAFKDGSFDPVVFYNEVVAARAEHEIYQSMNSDLYGMADALVLSESYVKTLEEYGVNVREQIPEWISGDIVREAADGTHELVTSVIAPGGFDLDWQHGSIASGYLPILMRASGAANATEYLNMVAAAQKPFTYTSGTWKMQNGELFTDVAKLNPSAKYDTVADYISKIETVWEGYAVLKSDYQLTQPLALLQLEATTTDAASSYKVNDSPNVLTVQ